MPIKRAASRREASESIDIESRLAPFFATPFASDRRERADDALSLDDKR